MSYSISLVDPVSRENLQLDSPHQMQGSTYAVGGTCDAWLNITYNYARWYRKDGVFPGKDEDGDSLGIRAIYDLSSADSIPVITQAIHALEGMEDGLTEEEIRKFKDNGASGYWLPTRANAIRPLYQLLALAKLRPDGVWKGD